MKVSTSIFSSFFIQIKGTW